MTGRQRALCTCSLASVLALTVGSSAFAISPSNAPELKDMERLRAEDGRRVRSIERLVPDVTPPSRAKAMAAFERDLPVHRVLWGSETAQPRRIMLADVAAPGAVDDADVALRVAQEAVLGHLDLLAPGSRPEDFELVTNAVHGDVRSVAWVQRHRGMQVVGGQLSASFKGDHLSMVSTEAVPHMRLVNVGPSRTEIELEEAAKGWLERDLGTGVHTRDVHGEHVILPVPTADGRPSHHEVIEVVFDVDTVPPTRWSVFVETSTGRPIARRQTFMFGQAGVRLRVPVRGTYGERMDVPARSLDVSLPSGDTFTSPQGFVTVAGAGEDATLTADGQEVFIINDAGSVATAQLFLASGAVNVWDESTDERRDAQVTTFAHANIVNDFAFDLDPDLAWITGPRLQATVNIDDVCNAFSDGDTINFFLSSADCENTGRLTDVVYHEYGHSLHSQSIIPGVGAFEGALSEGISDYLASTLVSDPGMGRGFFYNSEPLRQLDPVGYEWRWPEDTGPVHDEGRIIGGTLWDLRTRLSQEYGASTGRALANEIYYQATRRATDIPTMYPESLLVDDDDGDLSNGTPNLCLINEVFGAHGLYSLGVELSPPVPAPSGNGSLLIEVSVANPDPECPVDFDGTLSYRPRGSSQTTEVELVSNAGSLQGVIPAQPDGTVLNYRVELSYDNGSVAAYPSNQFDPWYEYYFGPVTPIYCTSFEDGAPDWTLDGSQNAPEWEVGAPQGLGGDPAEARDGTVVLGTNLSGSYVPGFDDRATSPAVNVAGFEKVRLQYWRWLGVEDAFYDQASIYLNGQQVWQNYSGSGSDNHRDGEWRFHDVDISSALSSGSAQISFELRSDGGLEFDGWNVDDLCIVGIGEGTAVCGNGIVEPGETCDDGNTTSGDGCSSTCQDESNPPPPPPPSTGSGGEDAGEDAGETGDGGDPSADFYDRGCGCDASGDRDDTPALALLLLGLGGLGLRRRRR